MPDVDIDFFDRDGVLSLFKHTSATMIKKEIHDLKSYESLGVYHHLGGTRLGNNKIKVVSIVDGKVISSNKNYEDYLKDTLVTNIKSVNVGTLYV